MSEFLDASESSWRSRAAASAGAALFVDFGGAMGGVTPGVSPRTTEVPKSMVRPTQIHRKLRRQRSKAEASKVCRMGFLDSEKSRKGRMTLSYSDRRAGERVQWHRTESAPTHQKARAREQGPGLQLAIDTVGIGQHFGAEELRKVTWQLGLGWHRSDFDNKKKHYESLGTQKEYKESRCSIILTPSSKGVTR